MANKKMCCVMGCPSIHASPQELLYIYPPKTTQRYKRWLSLFPNSFLLHPDQDNFICRRHFTPESFDDKLRLKHSADPTINIDTSYAQDQILRTFHTKVVYEWSLRNNIDDVDLIAEKASEIKYLLGMSTFRATQGWISKFVRIRQTNMQNGVRFGKNHYKGAHIFEIIKDLRQYLPSNFSLPVDLMNVTLEGNQLEVRNECHSDDDDMNLGPIQQTEECDQRKVREVTPQQVPNACKDALVLQQVPNTYQDVLVLLKPLEAYIRRVGNVCALVRLQEIEAVVEQIIKPRAPRK